MSKLLLHMYLTSCNLRTFIFRLWIYVIFDLIYEVFGIFVKNI